jgi:hypothetical protein
MLNFVGVPDRRPSALLQPRLSQQLKIETALACRHWQILVFHNSLSRWSMDPDRSFRALPDFRSYR